MDGEAAVAGVDGDGVVAVIDDAGARIIMARTSIEAGTTTSK